MKHITLQNILSVAIIVLIIWQFSELGKKSKEALDYSKIQTMIIQENQEYTKELELLRNELKKYSDAPPSIIREYIKEKPTYIVNNYTDSIITIRDTVSNDSIDISTDFLTLHPNANKLISMVLTSDRLTMTNLYKDGNISGKEYEMDFGNYDYMYIDNNLTYKRKNNQKEKFHLDWSQLYIEPGYDIINKLPTTSLDYQLNLSRKLRVSADAGFIWDNQPRFNSTIKLGYRLFR